MNSHTLRVLEYDKIKAIAAAYAVTELGRAMVLELQPASEPAEVLSRLQETGEATRLLLAGEKPPLDGIKDIRPLIARLETRGGILDPHELLNIVATLKAGRGVKAFFARLGRGLSAPVLSNIAGLIRPIPDLEEAILAAIDEQAEIRDSASPALRKTRRQIARVREEIIRRLSALMQDSEARRVIQDAVITQRDDRYVLPLKPNFRQEIKGIVHGQSGSGATLFVEPLDLLDHNNRLAELRAEEKEEVLRILRHLTTLAADHVEAIYNTLTALSRIDAIMSRARFGIDYGAVVPEISTDGGIYLKDARHPLLLSNNRAVKSPASVQANDITIGKDARLLIISGPNAGGKTVILKTVGLLSLMAQSGLPITAAEGSRLPVFRQVFADIGDEQSIEESISTFSSHARRIVEILREGGKDSLVLLDELGAGTDPAEGAALGAAVLERLIELGPVVVVTTHLSQLKLFGSDTDGAVNASMQFDPDTLRPTYRMITGIPGRSYGLEMALRIGVPQYVVLRARERLGSSESRLEDLLVRMEQDSRALAGARSLAEEEYTRARQARIEAERLLDTAKEESRMIKVRAEAEARDLIRSLRKKLNELSSAKIDSTYIAEARKEIEALSLRLQTPKAPTEQRRAQEFSLGERVRIPKIGATGVVTGLHSSRMDVDIRGKSISIPYNDALPIDEAVPPAPEDRGWSAAVFDTEGRESSLNIIGLRVDEAVSELDRFMDRAGLSGLPSVMIIHGLGTGALKQAVAEFLKTHPLVERIRSGSPAEGGAGVTVAELKR